MKNELSNSPKSSHLLKFVIMSIIGIFLFMVPLPTAAGTFNIPLGFAINWLGLTLNSVQINGFDLLFVLAMLLMTVSLVMTIIAYAAKPAFIMNSENMKRLFLSSPVYFVSKAIGVVLTWMVFLSIGPSWLIGWEGGRLMMDLISGGSSGSNLMSIFLIIGLAIPLLTDFGLMEFLGILIKKVVRTLFTLPGRSSIDLLGSWFSSSAGAVIITRSQHEKGYYTGREAAAICVNFTLVSLPFTFVIASTVGVTARFGLFYLVICVTAILLAVVMPRIWPLRGLKDEYLPEVGKQIDEEVPENTTIFKQATRLAGNRAGETTAGSVLQSGFSNWLNIFMDLIPVIMAWGTIAIIVAESTPVFDILSWPFGWYLNVFGIEGAFDYAHTTIVGFIDMFLPAIFLSDFPYAIQYAGQMLPYGEYAVVGGQTIMANSAALVEGAALYGGEVIRAFTTPVQTRFILGALSIVQIIYMAETGILILKSKIPLHIGHLLVLFVMRTILALPLIVLFYRIIF